MALLSTTRRCPYCAEEIKLGDCPIVATNFPEAEFLPDENFKASQVKLPSRTRPDKTLKTGWPIVAEAPAKRSKEGNKKRSWGFSSFGGSSSLPPLFEDAAREDLPARSCPSCELPLPQSIDERPALVIGVVGVNRVGKTHLLASCLTEASKQRGLARIGCRDFSLDESTAQRFREKYYEPLFRQGEVLEMSLADAEAEKVRFRPLVFNATLPNLGRVSLILHDVAGEIMADPRRRAIGASYLRGAEGIIFVIDPREIDSLRGSLPQWILQSNQVGFDQGALLSACLRPDGIVDRDEVIPIAIAIGKADLLPQATGKSLPFLSPAPAQEDPPSFVERIRATSRQVADFLEEQQAYDILDPARAYGQTARSSARNGNGQVTFHAFSALGSAPDSEDNLSEEVKPLNCIDPLATVLAQVQMSAR
ncbi:MAG TPA: hypothetical protein VFX44_08250 [Solirubrobacterales bacterium]|nr:hypothetical protein [Solirubrobacterales bacterium]